MIEKCFSRYFGGSSMKKLTKIILASSLAIGAGAAAFLGFKSTIKEQSVETKAEEEVVPDGTVSRPYKISSYEDLSLMNNAPRDGTPTYYSLAESWVYHEKMNVNYIDISCYGSDGRKVIWLDLNGKTIMREGKSTDTSTFHIVGLVEMYIYDSHQGSGEIQMWLDNYSNDSSLFYVSAGATLNIINGRYTYLMEYNASVYGGGSQFAHRGDVFNINGTGKVNIYDGYFNAADNVIYSEKASGVTIYNGRFTNLRSYDVFANRRIVTLYGEGEKFADTLGPSTIFSPEPDQWCGDDELWGASSFTFTSKNSNLIYSNIPNNFSEITIDQGEEYAFTIWRSNAYDFKWKLDNTTITEGTHPALQLIGENTLVIKPSLANGLLDNHYIFLSFKFMKNQEFVTRDNEYIGIHVNRTHYVITFDLGGHGENMYEFSSMSESRTFADVVNSVTPPENDDDYYFLGFAKDKLSYYADVNSFVRAANALKSETNLIDFDYILYGGWRGYDDDVDGLTFNQPTIKQLDANGDLQSIGKVSFSGLIEKSLNYTQFYEFLMKITFSSFHAQDDETETLDYSIYYKIGDAEPVKYDGVSPKYITFFNKGNGVTDEVELLIKIDGFANRNADKNYVGEFSYRTYIYDSEDAIAKSYSDAAPTNLFMLKDEPVPVVLDSISLSGTQQTTFRLGDTFSSEGLVVTANYSNGTSKDVTSASTISEPDMSTTGVKDVNVSYTDGDVTKTASYQINVVPAETPVLFESISLSGDYKTEFKVGDTFTSEGLVVTAHYDGKDDEEVTGFEVDSTAVNMNEAGIYTVTVSYTVEEVTNSATYQVTVTEEETPVDPGSSEEPETPEAPETPKKKGCGGSLLAASIAIPTLLGLGTLVLIKKRKEK